MACRNMELCESVRTSIVEETCNLNIHCHHLDLSSLASVRKFAEKINSCKWCFLLVVFSVDLKHENIIMLHTRWTYVVFRLRQVWFRDPDKAVSLACICLCVLKKLFNSVIVNLDIWHASLSWLFFSYISRSQVKVHGHRKNSGQCYFVLGLSGA